MKNKSKSIILIVGSMLLIIIISVFYIIKYSNISIDKNIMNKTWYHYDYKTGYYNTFFIDENSLVYNNSNSNNNISCKNYSYLKSNNSLLLDCGNEIKIEDIKPNNIIFTINSKKTLFYDNIEDTLNHEFESYYDKSISEYKKDMSRVSEIIKIDYNRFYELFNTDDYSKIIFYGKNCTSVDCALALNIIEKWIATSENIYYININEFTDKNLLLINKLNNEFSINKNYYDNIYPRVMIIKNKKIIDQYEIKCNGFNCNKYFENEF